MMLKVHIALLALIAAAVGRCPDVDVKCRIFLQDSSTISTASGALDNVTASIGEVDAGMQDAAAQKHHEKAVYYVAGTLPMKQCWRLLDGCHPNYCSKTMGTQCNETVPVCTLGCLHQAPECAAWKIAGRCDPTHTVDLGGGPIEVTRACPQSNCCKKCVEYFGKCDGQISRSE